jgi:hypothetical protein
VAWLVDPSHLRPEYSFLHEGKQHFEADEVPLVIPEIDRHQQQHASREDALWVILRTPATRQIRFGLATRGVD